MMKKIFTVTYFLLFILPINSFALDPPFPGETLIGTIGKYGLGTEIVLPEGEWIVAGVSKTNGSVRWVELVLIQSESNKIKGIFNIKYPRRLEKPIVEWDPSTVGWRKDKHIENNTCDDYEGQGSNFHKMAITKKKSNRIYEGSCVSVYASNRLNSLFITDAWSMAEQYINRQELEYPNALVFIDNTYFREKNVVHTYFATNPYFSKIKSNSNSRFEYSDWYKYNISKHSNKNEFMNQMIDAAISTAQVNINRFLRKEKLDFSSYSYLHVKKSESVIKSEPSKLLYSDSVMNKLKELKAMLDEGLINQDQYDATSAKLLEGY